MTNYSLYSRKDVVEKYSTANKIQLPEATLIQVLGTDLQKFKVLDLGVGGGRTTLHFGNIVSEYIGTDFSSEMVHACKERFKDVQNLIFKVADASNLSEFKSEYFDLVLFSFNGIDYLDQEKRIDAIREAYRVLKKGGIFFFSTHNTMSIKNLFKVQKTYNPVKLLWRICRYILLTFLNGRAGILSKSPIVSLNDGSWGFGLRTVYISPRKQTNDLVEIGFHSIRAYSIGDGKEIQENTLEKNEENRIYYFAVK